MHRKPILMLATAVMAGALATASGAEPGRKPLKVYILAGQSNMEGHAQVKTFPHIGMDPATAPLLKRMLGQDGKPRVLEEVAIASIRGTSVQEE